MNHSLWKKVALGTAVACGGFALQAAPASAISLGIADNEFKDIDGDNIDDKVVAPNSTVDF